MLRWYKADSFNLADGEPVGSGNNYWVDNSPNAGHLYCNSDTIFPTIINNSFNGLPAVDFSNRATGVNLTGLTTLVPAISGQTFFLIYYLSYTGNQSFFGGTTTNFDVQRLSPSGIKIQYEAAGNPSTSNINTTVLNTLGFISISYSGNSFNGTTTGQYLKYPSSGTTIQSNLDFFTGRYHRIGRSTSALTNLPFSGKVCELLVYQSGFSNQSQALFLDNYFRPKWGF